MPIWIGLGVYMLIGVGVGFLLDRWEQGKEIPWGDAPGWIPLSIIRFSAYLAAMLFWLPVLIRSLFEKENDQ